MKVLFCYGGDITADINGNYFPETFSEEILNRYFSIGKELYRFGNIKLVRNDKTIEVIESEEKLNSFEVKTKSGMMSICGFSNEYGVSKIIPCHNFMTIKGMMYKNKVFRKKLTKKMKEFDVVIIRLPNVLGNIAVDVARKLKKPYLIEVVACPWDAFWNHSFKGKLVAPFMYYATKKRVKDAKYVVYVTNEFLQNRYPTKGQNIGCSDVELPSLDESILDKRLNKVRNMFKNKSVVIGTTAAVNVRYKGQEYVIKAISKLNKEGYNFEYYLAGGGDNSYLKSVAEKYCVLDKVKFLGALPHDKVFEYLDNIDIYIQPSKQEGLPRALVEAMSRGCPALGSTTGGIPELLNYKFIFNNGSICEICNLIKNMDKKIMMEEAKRSFEKAKQYDKDLLDKKRKKFYSEFKNHVNEVISK
ncbi:glycosyltransferase family 4 protein [Haloimpatiens sp. FM7330]|uniref:glycosyltransferase family 4 protein n=1 Tax=Haloimpatiens sp. FM7330 TaxID=3298610 RepID=UPI003625C1B7